MFEDIEKPFSFQVWRLDENGTISLKNNAPFGVSDLFLFKEDKSMQNEKQIFTDKEAAAYLRIGQTTLWRLRKTGKISFRRSASKIVYTETDLKNYLESTKRNAFAIAGGV